MFAAMRHQESLDDLWSPIAISQYLRYLRFLVGVGVRSAMQLAMNASPAPRGRRGSVALPNCS